MIRKIKNILFFFLCFFYGCTRVNTNPHDDFTQVKANISDLTGKDIYWDTSVEKKICSITKEDLIQKELTEDFAIHIALLNNKDLQATYETLGIAKANLAQAGLLKNPIFSFAYPFSIKSNLTDLVDLKLFQNFLDFFLLPLKKNMAKAELEATKTNITTQVLEVIAQTKMAFYMLKAQQKIWSLKKQLLLASELSYIAAQKLFFAGNITEVKMAITRSLYEQSKLDVANTEITVLKARENLNLMMGLWGKQIDWKISSNMPTMPPTEKGFKNIENNVIAASLDLKIFYQRLLANAATLGIDTSKVTFPQLDLGVSTSREDNGFWYIGPAINIAIPFFDLGYASSAKAKAQIIQQWNQFTSLAVKIRSKARSARFFLLNAFRQAQYLQKIILPLSEEITTLTLQQHNAMQIGIFDLLSIKKEEIEKKIQYVTVQKEYWIEKIKLQTLLAGHVLEKNNLEIFE